MAAMKAAVFYVIVAVTTSLTKILVGVYGV